MSETAPNLSSKILKKFWMTMSEAKGRKIMQVIENLKVKEKLYTEKLENGLTVMIIPKKGIQKKYIIWGTNYGSNDSTFIVPGETEITEKQFRCSYSIRS